MIDGKSQSWCALSAGRYDTDVGHVTLDLLAAEVVAGVVTQGRGVHGQFVRQIKVVTSVDGTEFKFIANDDGSHKVFTANHDVDSKVFNKFDTEIRARFVRVHPWDYSGHPSMRVGVTLKARKLRTVYTKCMDTVSFDKAEDKCSKLGGRLCTSKEVLSC